MRDAQLEANWRDYRLEQDGLLEPGQPTESAHVEHVRRMEAEFTPLERRLIRAALGLGAVMARETGETNG